MSQPDPRPQERNGTRFWRPPPRQGCGSSAGTAWCADHLHPNCPEFLTTSLLGAGAGLAQQGTSRMCTSRSLSVPSPAPVHLLLSACESEVFILMVKNRRRGALLSQGTHMCCMQAAGSSRIERCNRSSGYPRGCEKQGKEQNKWDRAVPRHWPCFSFVICYCQPCCLPVR